MPELRKDPVAGRWVVILTRQEPGAGGATLPWSIRVSPNKFNTLINGGQPAPRGEGLHEAQSGGGAHEIIVQPPDHQRHLRELDRT
jgi:UDPglucose--hexose-1-phosphate uridylyltransferase